MTDSLKLLSHWRALSNSASLMRTQIVFEKALMSVDLLDLLSKGKRKKAFGASIESLRFGRGKPCILTRSKQGQCFSNRHVPPRLRLLFLFYEVYNRATSLSVTVSSSRKVHQQHTLRITQLTRSALFSSLVSQRQADSSHAAPVYLTMPQVSS
jgi:hypothetical protein